MAPPKCFFKRPEEFYSSGNSMLQSPKVESFSTQSPLYDFSVASNMVKSEHNVNQSYRDHFHIERTQQSTPIESVKDPMESPLDLSRKCSAPDENDLLKKLSNYLLQHQQQLARVNQSIASNQYLNLERLFSQLPQQFYSIQPTQTLPAPKVYITPPPPSSEIDQTFPSPDLIKDSRLHLSPRSFSESQRDNSSSETSSQYTSSQLKYRSSKRKLDGKQQRPFKLYKGTDSQGLMEALGINGQDEEWLKSIVEYKSVDDVFLFLTNCMNETTKPRDLSDDIIETIKTKFGHIFQNCNSTISNPKMVRHPDMTPRELKTDEYWEKRRKNNEAAKRSREARRNKEDTLNQHCEKLQSENENLRKEIERVKSRIDDIKRSIS